MSEPREAVRALGTVHTVPITQIRPHPRNPRQIGARAVELVALSLQRFGWQQPLVIDRDNVLVVGHTRLQAAVSLGLVSAPVVIAEDLSPEEVDAYRIADNRTHDFTTWDMPELASQLETLSDDFADVLALTDWSALVASMDDLIPTVDVDPDTSVRMDGGFQLVLVFDSKESAQNVERSLLDIPGVLDVRYRQASS